MMSIDSLYKIIAAGKFGSNNFIFAWELYLCSLQEKWQLWPL